MRDDIPNRELKIINSFYHNSFIKCPFGQERKNPKIGPKLMEGETSIHSRHCAESIVPKEGRMKYRKEQIRIAAQIAPKIFGLPSGEESYRKREYVDVIKEEGGVRLRAYNIGHFTPNCNYCRPYCVERDEVWSKTMATAEVAKKVDEVKKISPLYEAVISFIGNDVGCISASWVEVSVEEAERIFPGFTKKWTFFANPQHEKPHYYHYLQVGEMEIVEFKVYL